MITLDEVCATMRQRFTEAAASGATTVPITADEWNALATGVYLRDALETVLDFPTKPDVLEDAAGVLLPQRRK